MYRAPFLRNGMAGVAAQAVVKALKAPDAAAPWAQWARGREGADAAVPALLLAGDGDKYAGGLAGAALRDAGRRGGFDELRVLEGVGHFAQEDWPEKVVEALVAFVRERGVRLN